MYKEWATETMGKILGKLSETAPKIGANFPHIADGEKYNNETPSSWVSGFWPGILWLAYSFSKDEKFSSLATQIEEKMDVALADISELDHDVGFMWLLSAGADWRITGSEKSYKRVLNAAHALASRFNIKGNYIRAWNRDLTGWAIIDCTMNIPILSWAAERTGDPRFRHIAEAHADTVVKHFIRPDGSSRHIVSFDAETGEFLEAIGGQGAGKDSAWSRGNAWAIYGLALAYRHIGKEEYLTKAKCVANHFIANLPKDMVAHWDFRAERTEDTPRDTSAAACAACGLLELALHLPEAESKVYTEKAYEILRSLTDNYSNYDNSNQALLTGGTSNYPINFGINVGLIYGDYFYMEGISRLMGNKEIFWYSK